MLDSFVNEREKLTRPGLIPGTNRVDFSDEQVVPWFIVGRLIRFCIIRLVVLARQSLQQFTRECEFDELPWKYIKCIKDRRIRFEQEWLTPRHSERSNRSKGAIRRPLRRCACLALDESFARVDLLLSRRNSCTSSWCFQLHRTSTEGMSFSSREDLRSPTKLTRKECQVFWKS